MNQVLNGMKFRIARQDRTGQLAGRGYAKRICVGDRMLALNLRRASRTKGRSIATSSMGNCSKR